MAGLTINPADIAKARESGYSDDEIAGFLSERAPDKFKAAREAGYASKEILDHLTGEADKPSGPSAGLAHGLAAGMKGVSSTLKHFAGVETPALNDMAAAAEPENYHGAEILPEGSHWYDPRTYNYKAIPQAVAEAAPGMATDIAAAKVASKLPVIGKVAGPVTGIASYLLRTRGDAAKRDAEIRTGSPDAQPETQDLVRSAATGVAESIPQAIGIGRFLPGGKTSQTASQALAKLGITGVTEGGAGAASNAISQAGATIGTPSGLKVDPNEVASAGLTSGITGGALAVPGAAGEVRSARKYAPFHGENQQATEAMVSRVNKEAEGGSLKNVKTSFEALRTADEGVRDELKAAVKPLKGSLDQDTAAALKNAGKGRTLTDADLQTIEANTTPDVAFLARQAHVASLIKKQGDFGAGRFVGGTANAVEKHIRALQNPIGAGVSAGLGAAGLGGHAASLFAYGPQTLAAIAGGYAGLRLLDRATGSRSPMASLAERFQTSTAPTRLPAPVVPEAPRPTSGPTGPNVEFNPGVANGGTLLATGQSPWKAPAEPAKPFDVSAVHDDLRGQLLMASRRRQIMEQNAPAAPAPLDANAANTQVKAALESFSARQKWAARRAAMGIAEDSPLVQDNGGLDLLGTKGVGKEMSALVSAARAHQALMRPREEAEGAAPQMPSPPITPDAPVAPPAGPTPRPNIPALLARLAAAQHGDVPDPAPKPSGPVSDILADVTNATAAKAKITKKKGKVETSRDEAPHAPEDAYTPLADAELFGRGWSDHRFAEHQASQKKGLNDPEAYKDGVVRDRQKRRGIISDLIGEVDADHPDHELGARLLEELHHVRRRAKAKGAIKHFTEGMSPEVRDAIRKRLDDSLVNSMWNS
jgi:hypothetical protein